MGNLCADNMYKQVKDKYPQDFQKFVEMSEVSKQLESKAKQVQNKVIESSQKIKNDNLATVDSKNKEVKDHFLELSKDIDHSYPGGLGFLQSSKQAKLEELLGFSAINKQFGDIKENLKGQFSKEQDKVSQEISKIKDDESNKLKDQTPKLELFNQMTESAKQSIYNSGLSEYKTQIEAKSKQLLKTVEDKFKGEKYDQRFKNLLPIDRLQSLCQISKEEMSKKAHNFIGEPGEGKATLY